MQYHLLGGLAVTHEGTTLDLSTPKQRAVLAVLLLERDRVVSVDRLIELLWGDEADKALSSLQAYISRLRSTLEPHRRPRDPARVLVSQPPGYRLIVDRSQVDLYQFEDETATGLEWLRDGRPGDARTIFDSALARWTGPVLPELSFEPFVISTASRVNGVRVSALEGAAEARLALGEHHAVVTLLEAEADRHPTSERMHGLLALALYRAGRQVDALRVVDRCRKSLIDTSGLDLGSALRQLETDLLAQSATLDWRPTVKPAPITEAPLTAPPERPNSTGADANDLVGRTYERGVLETALKAAEAGRGGIAVILGEPGIGKTRLAESLAESARSRGIAVGWARCPESRSAPPFWPLTQLAHQMSVAGLIEQGVRLDWMSAKDTGQQRFHLYRSVLDSIAAIDRPLILVIDDMQWADPDTLRLIEHIAADVASTHCLFVATLRPPSDDLPDALFDCLAEVARVPGNVSVSPGAFKPKDVATWLRCRTDVDVPDEVVALVHDRTGGNPLFVKEFTELLVTEGLLDDATSARRMRAIPPGVQFVVRRRVSGLPMTSQQLLAVAAVLGPTFDVNVLAATAGLAMADVLAAIGPALDAGLVIESDTEFSFSHALVSDALAGEVNAVRRATIHAAAARSLASVAGPGFGVEAARIAHHAIEGILAGTGDLAVDAGTAAARLAGARFAHEDAAGHWANVAAALARSRPSDARSRIDALIAQADALNRADQVGAAKAPILEAVELAEAMGMVDSMARAAALLNQTHVWANEAYGVVDTQVVQAIERTLGTLSDAEETSAVRAVLLGALASELVFADESRHAEACRRAEAAARAAQDPVVLARVLNNLMLPNHPENLDERHRRSLEMIAIAEANELPPDLVFAAHHHMMEYHLETVDFTRAIEAQERAMRSLDAAPGSQLLGQHHWFHCSLATATGRYEEAATLLGKAFEIHRRGRRYDADTFLMSGRLAAAIDVGGLDELLPVAIATAQSSAYNRPLSEALAFAMLELRRSDIARMLVEPFGPSAAFPHDWVTLFCATAALHVRVELGDTAGASAAMQPLADHPNRWAAAGSTPLSMGVVDLALARHSAFEGNDDLARSQFAEAIGLAGRAGAVGWLARGLVHQGLFLRQVGDESGGRAALDRARELAVRHGFPYVIRRLEAG